MNTLLEERTSLIKELDKQREALQAKYDESQNTQQALQEQIEDQRKATEKLYGKLNDVHMQILNWYELTLGDNQKKEKSINGNKN